MFAELSLPITDSFQAQLAARYEDYGGGIGSTFDPKLSLRWQLVDSFALRGSVGTTFRGPALQQTDPSSVTTLQNVAGTFRAIRTFGDPDLKPESALTFNVGMLVKAGGFSASVDYWRSTSRISSSTSRSRASRTSCSARAPTVHRWPGESAGGPVRVPRRRANGATPDGVINDADCTTANIARLDINVFNGPDVKTDGIDLSAQFDWDMLGGTATIGLNATYVLKYDIDPTVVGGNQVAAAFDAAGKLNYQTTAYPAAAAEGQRVRRVLARCAQHPLHDELHRRLHGSAHRRVPAVAGAPIGIAISAGKTIDSTMFHDLSYLVQLPWETALSLTVENSDRRRPVVCAPGPVLRPVHLQRPGPHLQGGIAQAVRCGVKGKRQGDVDRSGAARESRPFFLPRLLLRQRPALFPGRLRPERRRQEVHERPHLRHQVAALGIDGINGQLLRLELAQHRLERAAAQLLTEVESRQQHDAAAGQRGRAIHQAVVRLDASR